MLYVIDIKCSLWSILKLIGSVTRTRVLHCQILFNSCCAGDRQSCTVCACNSLLFRVWFSFSDDCFISDSFYHIPYVFFFSSVIVIYVLVWQLDNSLSAFLPVSSPLSIAQYKITLKYCPVFMSLGSRLPAPIYCWDGSRGCVQWAKKKKRKRKALILNWGCFPHLSTEGH